MKKNHSVDACRHVCHFGYCIGCLFVVEYLTHVAEWCLLEEKILMLVVFIDFLEEGGNLMWP